MNEQDMQAALYANDEEMANVEKIMRRVSGLLAKAENAAATDEEKAAYFAKAQELMGKYRLADEQLRAESGGAAGSKITRLDFRISARGSNYSSRYLGMAYDAAWHAGVQMAHAFRGGESWGYLVGYEADVRLAEMLFMSAALEFAANMEPSYDASLSEQVNAFQLRHSGWTRRAIAVKLWGYDKDRSVPAHQKVQKMYEDEAKLRGITVVHGRGVSRKDFVEVYAGAFVSRFSQRLQAARNAADSTAGALVFAKRKEDVMEAFYAEFPHLRPAKDVEPASEYQDARTDAQKRRDSARYEAMAAKRRALYASEAGRAGWAAGTSAADKVALDGVAPAKRIDS